MQPRRLAVVLGAVLLCAAPLPAGAVDRLEAARRAAQHLVAHQAPDGTFFGDDAPHHVAETLVALVAGGATGPPVARAVSFVASAGPKAADRAGEAGLLVLGMVAGGQDPRPYADHLRSFYDDRLGVYDTQQFQNALALLGVVAAGERIPEQAITFLRLNRCPDGGIPITVPCGGAGGHVDVTALVVQALVRHGLPASDPLRADARSFLVAAQNDEGGFGDTKKAATNANSTGLVLGAIAAMGEAPWRDSMARLLALQQPDGRFRQSKAAEGDSYLATRQAVPGLAGRPHPVQPNPAPTTSTSTSTTLAFRRNPAPGRAISPENRVAAAAVGGGGERERRRRRPTGPAAIATALLLAVAWRGARLPRPRGDHASAP